MTEQERYLLIVVANILLARLRDGHVAGCDAEMQRIADAIAAFNSSQPYMPPSNVGAIR